MNDGTPIGGLRGGTVWTGDTARPFARSITIEHDRITRIDAMDAPMAHDQNSGETVGDLPGDAPDHLIDLTGRFIMPGFIDTHTHLLMAGEALTELDLSTITSRAAFEAAIAARHAELPPGEWLLARGWSSENWSDADGGDEPDASWLRAAGDRPVVCHRMDSHACLVNHAVLKMIDTTQDPLGGRIVRGDDGRPTGLLIEAAAWQLVNPIIPQRSAELKQRALLAAQRVAHGFGITSIGVMEYMNTLESVYEPIVDQLTLRIRATVLDRDWPLDFSAADRFTQRDQLAIIGFKAFLDGTLGSRSARLLAAYADDPGNCGLLVELAAEGHLFEWIRAVAKRGWQPSMHAIGDAAARLALEAIESLGALADAVDPRIEHAQQVDPADIPRFAGRIASMQPLHRADDGRYAARRLGPERVRQSFAFRQLANAGARFAFGSDWPIVTADPIPGIRAAVTGLTLDDEPFNPQENLSVEETLRAYTRGAAEALKLEDTGVLREGARADLVVLDRDPFEIDWTQETPRVVMTIAGGRIVHDELGVVHATA